MNANFWHNLCCNVTLFCLCGSSACPVCYLPVEEAIALMPKDPSPSPVLKDLTYVYEENLSRDGEFGGSDFGGYSTLRQRNDSYDIRESMSVHCGYVHLHFTVRLGHVLMKSSLFQVSFLSLSI